MGVEDAAVADEDRPFDGVLQLADVAGPVVHHQDVDGGRRDAPDVLAVAGRVLLDEMVGEERDVRPSVRSGGTKIVKTFRR